MDYWITLGVPGLEQLASAFSWPPPVIQRGIHLFNPSVNSRGKASHPCNEKSHNSNNKIHLIVQKGCAKGKHCWVTFLALHSHCCGTGADS